MMDYHTPLRDRERFSAINELNTHANHVVASFVKMVSFFLFEMDEKPGLVSTSKASVFGQALNPDFSISLNCSISEYFLTSKAILLPSGDFGI